MWFYPDYHYWAELLIQDACVTGITPWNTGVHVCKLGPYSWYYRPYTRNVSPHPRVKYWSYQPPVLQRLISLFLGHWKLFPHDSQATAFYNCAGEQNYMIMCQFTFTCREIWVRGVTIKNYTVVGYVSSVSVVSPYSIWLYSTPQKWIF